MYDELFYSLHKQHSGKKILKKKFTSAFRICKCNVCILFCKIYIYKKSFIVWVMRTKIICLKCIICDMYDRYMFFLYLIVYMFIMMIIIKQKSFFKTYKQMIKLIHILFFCGIQLGIYIFLQKKLYQALVLRNFPTFYRFFKHIGRFEQDTSHLHS